MKIKNFFIIIIIGIFTFIEIPPAATVESIENNEHYFYYLSNPSRQKKAPFIGIALRSSKEKFQRDMDAMQDYAASKGVRTLGAFAEYDAVKQEAQVDDFISQGINVLILGAVDPDYGKKIVEKAHKAGVKVIAAELIVENSDLDFYVAFNDKRIGELEAKYLIQAVPKGNYIVLSGDNVFNVARLLREGAMEYLQPQVAIRNIKIVTDKSVNWNTDIAFNIVEESLKENKNNIQAIVTPADNIAGAVIKALEAHGLAGKVPVAGQGGELSAVRRIVKGTQFMTVFKDSRELGRTAVDVGIKLINKLPIDTTGTVNNGIKNVPSILITPVPVTKDDIDQVLINSGFYTKEQVYGQKTADNVPLFR